MEIKGTLQPEDLISARWLYLRSRPFFVVFGSILFILTLSGFLLDFFGPSNIRDYTQGGFLLGVILYILFVFFVYIPFKLRRNYRQRKALQREVLLTISESGINSRNTNGSANIPWEDFLKWKAGKNMFLLYVSDSTYHIIPKRFFLNTEDIDRFHKILESKITG